MKYVKAYFQALLNITMVMGIAFIWGSAINGGSATASYGIYVALLAAVAGPIALRLK